MRTKFLSLAVALGFGILAMSYPSGTALSAPSVYPKGLTVPDSSGRAYLGYTLYTLKLGDKAVVVDMDGTEVHTWNIPGIGSVAKPLSNGHILTHYGNQGSMRAHTVAEFDWNGNEVWKYTNSAVYEFHHDLHRLPNGNTLVLASKLKTDPTITKGVFQDDIIMEISPAGKIVWQWSTAAHYSQLPLTAEARKIILSKNHNGLFHTNSIQVLPQNRYMATDPRFKAGNILVSQRRSNLVFIIDRATGNIVWSYAEKTIGQHHARMIPPGLPGAGSILLFDNGGWGGFPMRYRTYSIVSQINPSSAKIEWYYNGAKNAHQSKDHFFSGFRSGVQRLPNGNTFITESSWGRMFEVTPAGEIVWEYINPRFRFEGSRWSNQLYRGYRVDKSWVTGNLAEFIW